MDSVNIKLKVGGVEIPSHPVFGDDIKVKFSKEDNQVFLRTKIDGKVKFAGSDFDFISSCSHNETFTIEIYRGATLFGSGTFLKSDCSLNYDDKVCEVKLVVSDRYEEFLANYDNKYNLPKLAPDIVGLTLNKRPVLQIYFLGDKKITNAFGNMSFEVDAAGEADDKTEAQILACGFTKIFHWRRFILPSFPSFPSLAGIEGEYIGQFSSITVGSRVYRRDQQYYLEYIHYTESGWNVYFWQLYNSNGTPFDNNGKVFVISDAGTQSERTNVTVEWGSSYGGSAITVGHCKENNRVCYARALSDYSGSQAGETKKAFSTISSDVAEENYNYLYAWTVNTFNLDTRIRVSTEVQAEPTEYGIDGDGNYFVKPDPASPENAVYPIGWSMWIPISIWLETSPIMDLELRGAYNTTYQLQDAFPLHSAITRLLTAMGSDVVFDDTSVFSAFLYQQSEGLMDVMPTPAMRNKRIFITPITNVKKTRYEQAAQRGDITLKQILDMLRSVYQCYWYIDNLGRLCIEHISFFKNNHAYGLYTPTPLIDLTTMKDMPNGLPWAFGTNEVGFDRNNCPSRYEFEWGDESTEQFNGYAIDIKDKAAKSNSKERISVTNFVSDIDYTVINPSGLSDDIYAVIEADENTNTVSIENVTLGTNNPVYCMQNGNLSFLFAERFYYPYDLGGWDAVCNGVSLDVYATRHLATQEVGVPLEGFSLLMPQDIEVIKTGVGIGLLKSADVDASTMYAKAKLTLPVEKDDYKDAIRVVKSGYSHGTYALVIYNDSNVLLDIKYSYNGYVYSIVVSAGSQYYAAYGDSSLDPSMITILSATQNTANNTPIGRIVQRYGSNMTVTLSQTLPSIIYALFEGNNLENSDFAYVRIHLVKKARVTITASSETNYDIGYAASKPCISKAQVQSVGGIFASGNGGVASQVFNAGQDIYIGYSKDYNTQQYNDSVTIEVEDVE